MRKAQLVSSIIALLALVTVSSSVFAAPAGFDQTASPLAVVSASEPVSAGGYADGDIEVHAAQYGYYPYYGYYSPYSYYSYPYYSSYSYPYSYGGSYYPYSSYYYPYSYGYGYGYSMYPYYGYGYGMYPYYRYPYWY